MFVITTAVPHCDAFVRGKHSDSFLFVVVITTLRAVGTHYQRQCCIISGSVQSTLYVTMSVGVAELSSIVRSLGATENAGVENAASSKMQRCHLNS